MNRKVGSGWHLFNPESGAFDIDGYTFVSQIGSRLYDSKNVLASFVLGSVGRGTEDPYSDLDIVMLVENPNIPVDLQTIFAANTEPLCSFVKDGKHVLLLQYPLLKVEVFVVGFNDMDRVKTLFEESRITDLRKSILFDKTNQLTHILDKWLISPGMPSTDEQVSNIAVSFLYYFEAIHPAFQRGDTYRAYFQYTLAYNKLASLISAVEVGRDFLYQPEFLMYAVSKPLTDRLRNVVPSMVPVQIFERKEELFDIYIDVLKKVPALDHAILTEALKLRKFLDLRYPPFWRLRDLSLFGAIRQGMVFRAARLDRYPPKYLMSWLSDRKIKTLVDFRLSPELTGRGYDPIVFESVDYLSIPIDLSKASSSPSPCSGEVDKELVYASILHSPEFQAAAQSFFSLLSDSERYPLIFHCHQGVDRTGIMAALLLKLMGTSVENIVEDYLFCSHLSKAQYILSFLRDLERQGGARDFLQRIGVVTDSILENCSLPTSRGPHQGEFHHARKSRTSIG